jgi:hypothetical protein
MVMDEKAHARRVERLTETLRAIVQEAGSARSALCENELVIRLDTIIALATRALEEE